MPDDIITGKCNADKVVQVERVPESPRMVAPMENVEAALNLLEKARRPLVLVGKGMAWARAETEVRDFIERTQLPFLRSPMGKGVVPDDHPLSVAAARTLALQQADVVFLMGARFNWIFHFGLAPRFAKDVRVIQLDIAPRRSGTIRRRPLRGVRVGNFRPVRVSQQGLRPLCGIVPMAARRAPRAAAVKDGRVAPPRRGSSLTVASTAQQ